MGLIADLGRGPVGLDTAVFIYFIEEHPRFLPVVAPVFSAVASTRLPAITSGVTLLETLVIPYRSGNTALAARYEALLTNSLHGSRPSASSERRPAPRSLLDQDPGRAAARGGTERRVQHVSHQ